MPHKNENCYKLGESCFYRLKSVHKLADLLFSSVNGLNSLANTGGRYRCWEEKKKNGGTRYIEAPDENLKKIQRRISDLLQRIQPPYYLMAPVKKRSYVENAAVHRGSNAFCLLDIEDFFPSCTANKVYWFFSKRMHCAPHVAALITKIVTFQGHLPQGSPCSPILAYYAYSDMWEEIGSIADGSKCKLSIYADDITISGQVVPKRAVWDIKQTLHKHGHRYSEKKERNIIDKPADITGVIVKGSALLLPNRQHKKISDLKKFKQSLRSSKEIDLISRQLRGRKAQATQIQNYRDT